MPDKPATTILWLPRVQWTVSLLGVLLYTLAVVSSYLPTAKIGIALGLLGMLLQKEKLRIPAFVWLFAAFCLWTLLTAPLAAHPDLALEQVVERCKLLIATLIMVNTLTNERRLTLYGYFLIACFLVFPIRMTLVNYATGYHPFGRALGNLMYQNSNDLAALSLLCLGVIMSVLYARGSPAVVRMAAIVAGVLALTVIVLTQSRGAFLGTMAVLVPSAFVAIKSRPTRLIYIGAAVAIAASLVPTEFWQRMSGIGKLTNVETIADADPEGSAAERWELVKTGTIIFLDHPIAGVGLGGYFAANARYRPDIGLRDTHNTYLNVLAETGFVGLLLLASLVASVLRSSRSSSTDAAGAQWGMDFIWVRRATMGFLVSSLFGSYSGLSLVYLVLSLLWCGTQGLRAVEQEGKATISVPRRMR